MSSSSEEEDIIHTNEVKFPIGREKFFTTLSYHYFITVKKMTTAMKKRLERFYGSWAHFWSASSLSSLLLFI